MGFSTSGPFLYAYSDPQHRLYEYRSSSQQLGSGPLYSEYRSSCLSASLVVHSRARVARVHLLDGEAEGVAEVVHLVEDDHVLVVDDLALLTHERPVLFPGGHVHGVQLLLDDGRRYRSR